MIWETPYGKDAKYYTSGEWIIEWDDAGDGACPPDWLTCDGPDVAAALRREGFVSRGRWQVRRLTGPENSEAIEIAPTLKAAKAIVEARYA